MYKTKNIVRKQTRCPKCGGREFQDNDYYGYYAQCLQCSHIRDLGEVIKVPAKISRNGHFKLEQT